MTTKTAATEAPRYLGAVRLSHLIDETTSPERQREAITLSVKLRTGRLVPMPGS